MFSKLTAPKHGIVYVQINIVLHVWNKVGFFPVNFVKMQGFTDDTDACVQHLNSMTHLVF